MATSGATYTWHMQRDEYSDVAGAIERIEQELTLLVRRAQKVTLRGAGHEGPVERATYAILCRLHDAGAQRPGALADHFRLDASTISRQVAALEQAGLVERAPDVADRRAFLLRLTSHGEEVLTTTRSERRSVVRALLTSRPPETVETFAALLRHVGATAAASSRARC